MALSFQKEIEALLHQAAEQDPTVQRAAQGDPYGTTEEALQFLANMINALERAVVKIAGEIDEFRSVGGGES